MPFNPSTSSADSTNILTQVATTFWQRHRRPAAPAVVTALLEAEKSTRQQRLSYPQALLYGKWRLCFTAPRQTHFKNNTAGKGFYLPQIAPAQISFAPVPESSPESSANHTELMAIGNQVQAGPFLLRLTGPARYLAQKNLLSFDFTQIQLSVLGQTLYQGGFRGGKAKTENFEHQPISKLPFFAFFQITESFIAARGRGGGLALWIKED